MDVSKVPHWLLPFDRDAEFVVCRPLTVSGESWRPGRAVDKSKVSVRLLRELYERRDVRIADSISEPVKAAVRPPPKAVVGPIGPVRRGRPKGSKNKRAYGSACPAA